MSKPNPDYILIYEIDSKYIYYHIYLSNKLCLSHQYKTHKKALKWLIRMIKAYYEIKIELTKP